MLKIILLILVIAFPIRAFAAPVPSIHADGSRDRLDSGDTLDGPTMPQYPAFHPLETVSETRERHSSENFARYEQSGAPLGGYREAIGDPDPAGVRRPGYMETDSQDLEEESSESE